LRSAVQYQPRPTWQQQQQVGSRLRTLASQRQLSGMNVSVEGQTATLSGRVNSEHDRRISQLLISLEPGIRRVENRLIVQP
jgi:osmotically-inducible protein OsmY